MKTAAGSPTVRTAPLKVAAFRRFVLANLISATGSAMAPLALAYSVIGEGGGAGSLGLVLATNTVPTIVFLLAGGVLADRLSRSRILFLGNLLAAAAQGALAATVATGHATTASIAVCGFASGTAVALTVPAAQGAVSQIVPAEHLQQANVLLRLPGNAVKVLGPVVGGLVVAFSGPAWALAWDALTFAVAALLLLGLRLDAPPHRQHRPGRPAGGMDRLLVAHLAVDVHGRRNRPRRRLVGRLPTPRARHRRAAVRGRT